MTYVGALTCVLVLISGYGIIITYLYLLRLEKLAETQQQLDLTIKAIELHKTNWKQTQNGYEQRLAAYDAEVVQLKKHILGSGGNVDFTRLMSKKGYPNHD